MHAERKHKPCNRHKQRHTDMHTNNAQTHKDAYREDVADPQQKNHNGSTPRCAHTHRAPGPHEALEL